MLNKRYMKYLTFISSVILIAILLITPDILFSIINKSFVIANNPEALIFIILASLLFVTNTNKTFSIFLLSFFSIIQTAQFCNIKYFGTLISPPALYLMTQEISDVIDEAVSVFWNYIYIFPLVALPYFAIYKVAHSKRLIKHKFGSLITILTLAIMIFLTEKQSPNATIFSLENSIRTITGYIEVTTKDQHFKTYKPYSVHKFFMPRVKMPKTIVYILGESTNTDHMSLFGYTEDTTPKLRKLAKNDNFYYTTGIAGGIVTISSCKFMCNAIREPDNVKESSLDTVNLFKIAKSYGFKTFYISAQKSDLLSSIGGTPYIDIMITREQYPTQFSKKRDSFLFELIEKQEFTNRNFIVIHQRCIHSPYTKTVPKFFVPSKKFSSNKNNTINEYDNAILYNDTVIAGLFNIFNKFDGTFYIFWASDHNELTGQNGLWGHGHLDPETAKIPILIQSNDANFMKHVKEIFAITHYDICCIIADLMGHKIVNPNEEKDIYYINGVDFLGRCGYIKFRKDHKNKKIEYFTN